MQTKSILRIISFLKPFNPEEITPHIELASCTLLYLPFLSYTSIFGGPFGYLTGNKITMRPPQIIVFLVPPPKRAGEPLDEGIKGLEKATCQPPACQ